MSPIERMKAAAKVHEQIGEVASGVRGFISATWLAKETGIKRESIAKWAAAAGLSGKNHGRFGLCFFRP